MLLLVICLLSLRLQCTSRLLILLSNIVSRNGSKLMVFSRNFKMQWLTALCVLTASAHGGGVTKTSGTSGISQFWTDDYKVFDQIYGKTSDKEIYGATLPPSVGYDAANPRKPAASEKKERYIDNDDEDAVDTYQIDPYSYGTRYSNQLTKETYKKLTAKKPTKSPFKFISTDFKPISQTSDPEAYNYLRHLEKLEEQKAKYPNIAVSGFKPYLTSYSGGNPDEAEAYKSIQDILDAHDANKGKGNDEDDDQGQYLTYPGVKSASRSKKPKSRYPNNDNSKIRCPSGSGRCRKRATSTYRVRTRPYLRRIKHKIVY